MRIREGKIIFSTLFENVKLGDVYELLKNKFKDIRFRFMGYDFGWYEICGFYSDSFKKDELKKFIDLNSRLRVKSIRFIPYCEIECY